MLSNIHIPVDYHRTQCFKILQKHIRYLAALQLNIDPIITRHTSSLNPSWSHMSYTSTTHSWSQTYTSTHTISLLFSFVSWIRSHLFLSYAHIGCKSILLGSLHKPIHTKLLISMSTHIINLSTTIPQVLVICYPRTQLVYRKVSHHSLVA
jgi:hypothetical protein